MKAIQYHIRAIKIALEQLAKGSFMAFFIPAFVLTIFYWYLQYNLTRVNFVASWFSFLPYIGEYLDKLVEFGFTALDWILKQVYIFVILTLLSPVNTYLSEKLDSSLTGSVVKFDLLRFINDFFRMLFIVLLAITMELIFMSVYWLFSWIFGFGVLDNLMYFLIAAFFFGLSFYDYSLERYGTGVFGTIGYAFQNMLTMILTGSIFLLIFEIPFIGVAISGGITVMVSTIVFLIRENKCPKENSKNNTTPTIEE